MLISAFLGVAFQNAVPPALETRLIRDLIQAASGPSVRGIDMPSKTEADTACQELVEIGHPTVPYLLGALKSPKGWARVHTIEVLARIKDARAVLPILAILHGDPEIEIRAIAASNLGAFGNRGVIPDLLECDKSTNKNLAKGSWKSLGELRSKEAIPLLLKYLDSKVKAIPSGSEVRDYTPIDALAKIGDPAIDPLTACFDHTTGDRQKAAAIALGLIGTPKAIASLMAGVESEVVDRMDSAMVGLLLSSNSASIPVAIHSLTDKKHRNEAASYLSKHPTSTCLTAVKSAILDSLLTEENDSFFLSVATSILHKLNDRSSIPLLIRLLDHNLDVPEVIDTLGEFQDKKAVPCLRKLVLRWSNDEYSEASRSACLALAKFGTVGVDALSEWLKQTPLASPAVGHALSEFVDPRAAPKVIRFLAGSSRKEIKIGVCEALGRMKTGVSIAPLVQLLQDPSPEVEFEAARALALLSDNRAIPLLLKQSKSQNPPSLDDEWIALGAKAMPEIESRFLSNDISAAAAVAAINSPRTTALLAEGLRSTNINIANLCAQTLGERRSNQAAALATAMKRPELSIRFYAFLALRAMSQSQPPFRPTHPSP